ncbi:hypothetical protein B0I35DRAFT_125465 [Stachybotrys elegans]|uniref:Secreted protein n=1 Tax=Stachybotrys elegans TaxID=80388 RepID=A0A8K0SZ45_9HYPO|nr:hypothetical protein B0I35DRAFT_125465 [Stachybotrys elegans]
MYACIHLVAFAILLPPAVSGQRSHEPPHRCQVPMLGPGDSTQFCRLQQGDPGAKSVMAEATATATAIAAAAAATRTS